MDQRMSTTEDIDRHLDFGMSSWRRLPQAAESVRGADEEGFVSLLDDYAAERTRLAYLEGLYERGEMSERQSERYSELKRVAEEGGSILEEVANS